MRDLGLRAYVEPIRLADGSATYRARAYEADLAAEFRAFDHHIDHANPVEAVDELLHHLVALFGIGDAQPETITERFLERGQSVNGGFSDRQRRLLGQGMGKGWRRRAIGKRIGPRSAARFLALRDVHLLRKGGRR